jgi:uncharacterized coiled-coil protein SlyX
MPYRATDLPANLIARFVLQLSQAPDILSAVASEEDCVKQRGEVIARSFGLLFGVSGEELERSERRLLNLRLCERDAVIKVACDCISIHSNWLQDISEILSSFFVMHREAITVDSLEIEDRHKIMAGYIVETLSKTIQHGNGRTGTRLDRVHDSLSSQIKHLELTMGEKFDALETKMDQKIDGLETKMDQRIDGLETKMDQRIDGLETKMDQKIDALDMKVDALDKKMDQRIDALDMKVDALDKKVDQRIDALDKKMDQRIDSLETKMDSMGAMLAEVLKRLPAPPR